MNFSFHRHSNAKRGRAGGLCFALLMLDFGELPLYVSSALRSVAASGAY